MHVGKGGWSRYGQRQTVERALDIDIRAFAREGHLQPGRRLDFYWRWDSQPWWVHDQGASLLLNELDDDRVTIFYARDGKPTFENVEICWTVPNYGGRRPWWHCPDCDRRCAILYHDDHFRCRACAGLTYVMSQLSHHSRPLRQAVKRRRRLRWEYGQPFPGKPPRMHEATWARLLDDYEVTARVAQEAIAPVLSRMEAEMQTSRDNIQKIKRGELP